MDKIETNAEVNEEEQELMEDLSRIEVIFSYKIKYLLFRKFYKNN